MAVPGSTVGGYLRTQATIAGLVNLVLNPAIDWLTSRHKPAQPVWGVDGLVVNFVITSLILSTLVGAFAAWGVRREARAGRLSVRRTSPRGSLTGLGLGAAAAVVSVAAAWLLQAAGVATASLAALMLVKAVYSGVLGYLVAWWVIRKCVQ
ncbi:hypothetical protein [Mycolicibacterium austroafricanum]|uniref:hypothetical protein n=1 Tax=Mycolicibacterium austroafricanum TaxID=39687 RepID=UPI000CF89730|nr:hypothetical protein [Mycolicibacterium austroafricanum]PQP49075.1 hypothetical protein C6A88_12655 [Mycolicibacterium austroafricanum]QZT57665.1 hypothetical protein JN084_03335 [Mycolicibacterium austroafricanum]